VDTTFTARYFGGRNVLWGPNTTGVCSWYFGITCPEKISEFWSWYL